MTDQRKLSLAAGLALLFAVLAVAQNLGLGERASAFLDRQGRRIHYERELKNKGLSLHEGEYWKEQ